MKHLSLKLLSETVVRRRKAMKLSQTALSERTGVNRSILSRLEAGDYSPSVDQLLSLSAALGFEPEEVLAEEAPEPSAVDEYDILKNPINKEVYRLLEHLSDDERELLSMIYAQELKNPQIGEILGINAKAVR
jgi:transcriptional regulator with XRE-family HTH domain